LELADVNEKYGAHVNWQWLAKIGLEIVVRNVRGFVKILKDLLLPPRTSEYCAREWIKAHRLLATKGR
jgi:hypothetical protein